MTTEESDKKQEVAATIDRLMTRVMAEYHWSMTPSKFPFSKHNTLALCEEHGEFVKAVLDLQQGKTTIDEVRTELIQTMSMCIRLWLHGDSAVDLPKLCDCVDTIH